MPSALSVTAACTVTVSSTSCADTTSPPTVRALPNSSRAVSVNVVSSPATAAKSFDKSARVDAGRDGRAGCERNLGVRRVTRVRTSDRRVPRASRAAEIDGEGILAGGERSKRYVENAVGYVVALGGGVRVGDGVVLVRQRHGAVAVDQAARYRVTVRVPGDDPRVVFDAGEAAEESGAVDG